MKILYIEDTASYVLTIRRMATYLGHELITASTGEQGYQLISAHPDLILLDIHLPDMNGLTLARRLRDDKVLVPIIVFTGDLIHYNREQAAQAGCDDFIEKPFSLDTIKTLFYRYSAPTP